MHIPAIHRAHTRLQAYSRKANAGETRRKEYLRHLDEKETWLRLHLAFSLLGERVTDLPPTIIEELGRWCLGVTGGSSRERAGFCCFLAPACGHMDGNGRLFPLTSL